MEERSKLIQAYKATRYEVLDHRHVRLTIGHRAIELSCLFSELNSRRAAFITACNPSSVQLSETVNAAANRRLRQTLSKHSKHVLTGYGESSTLDWPREPSFLACDIDFQIACDLAIEYGQIALVWVADDLCPRLVLSEERHIITDGPEAGQQYPRAIASREGSSMVSAWTEYLVVSRLRSGSAMLEVCMFEGLGEVPDPEDECEKAILPEEISGKSVYGQDDGCFVGGELACNTEEDRFEYTSSTASDAISFISERHFQISDLVRASVFRAVSG